MSTPAATKYIAVDVANEIRRYRRRHRLTQVQLAARLGYRQSVISRLELAIHDPDMSTLRHISNCLRVRITIVIRDTEVSLKFTAIRPTAREETVDA